MMGFGGKFLFILVFIAENAGQKTIAINPHKKEPRLLKVLA
jgi:hypothetical protein